MAGRQRQTSSASACYGREVMRPIISSDLMGNRNVEIVPVGAWVEPANGDIQPDAVLAAKIEQEKINKLKSEKENQLRSFRRQVKKRVTHASQIKRQQQIAEAEKAFELERRVIQQSVEMGTSSNRKDTCTQRGDELEHAIKLRLLKKYGEDVDEWQQERQGEIAQDTNQNMRVTDKARRQLSSKISTPSLSEGAKTKKNPYKSLTVKGTSVTTCIKTPKVKTVVEPTTSIHSQKEKSDDKKDDDDDDEETDEDDDSDDDNDSSDDDDDDDGTYFEEIHLDENFNVVHIGPDEDKDKTNLVSSPSKSKMNKKSKGRPNSTSRLAAMLSQFTESHMLAKQKRQQAAVSRRIFMDREREAVRENIRRKQHVKKIASLKKEKEAYRQQLESMSHKELQSQSVDIEDVGIYEEEEVRQRLEALHVEEMVERRKQDLKLNREMERYLDALRFKLMEKARRLGMELPALCACGDIWDTHPETCANNCFFYKNNRAYARALQSLLASNELV